ncbi:MAG TPA: alkaline phosphatase family protein [Candidatus Acidoferrales bacterium]|nr:alkaline phosphatase family protein [Candidatus Acidoferrales bacterium]
MRRRNGWRARGWPLAALLVSACTSGTSMTPVGGPDANVASGSSSGAYIKHVIVVVQENRSYDNLFATFPHGDGATSGLTHTGASIPLAKANLYTPADINNQHPAFLTDYDGGKNDGFDKLPVQGKADFVYEYVDPSQIRTYWWLAKHYVLADHFFQTQSSGSFTAHQDLIRGGTGIGDDEALIDFPTAWPWGCDAPAGTVTSLITPTAYLADQGPFPCMSYRTLRDLLDAKSVSWKYYAPQLEQPGVPIGADLWNAFDAVKAVRYGSEWNTNVSMPNTNIFKDISSGNLAAVSWIVPEFQNSDHPGTAYGDAYDDGPAWVASIVNAIGGSQYWQSSAILILWDDWGGWYDHVPPPQLDDQGLGFRVPFIVVSPFAKKGYVDHEQYETASVVRFIEDNWRLGRLGTADKRAADILDAFDFARPARPFKEVP